RVTVAVIRLGEPEGSAAEGVRDGMDEVGADCAVLRDGQHRLAVDGEDGEGAGRLARCLALAYGRHVTLLYRGLPGHGCYQHRVATFVSAHDGRTGIVGIRAYVVKLAYIGFFAYNGVGGFGYHPYGRDGPMPKRERWEIEMSKRVVALREERGLSQERL